MRESYDLEERLLEYAARIIRLELPHRESRDVRRSALKVECWTFCVDRGCAARWTLTRKAECGARNDPAFGVQR